MASRNRKQSKSSWAWLCLRTVVNHESTIRVFEGGVRCQDRIVWFDNCSWNLRSWVDDEFQLEFLAIVDTQSFHQQRCETWTSATWQSQIKPNTRFNSDEDKNLTAKTVNAIERITSESDGNLCVVISFSKPHTILRAFQTPLRAMKPSETTPVRRSLLYHLINVIIIVIFLMIIFSHLPLASWPTGIRTSDQ